MEPTNDTGELLVLRDAAVDIARRASEKILKIYNTEFKVEAKKDDSPLTAADMASHHEIVAGLEALTPDVPILSEESSTIPFDERGKWRRYWLVDPLDGTREFVKRNGEFTVNIALIEGHQAIVGVVTVPVTGVCYMAARGSGAWKQSEGSAPAPIHVTEKAGAKLRIAGSRSHGSEELQYFIRQAGDAEVVSIGSSLKLCLVAEGAADVYPRLGLTSEWDTAAAQCVVEQAGGQVTTTSFEPLPYNTKESLLNPFFLVFGDAGHDWRSYLPESLRT